MQYVQLFPIYSPPVDPIKSGEIGNVAKINPIKMMGADEVPMAKQVIDIAVVTVEPELAEHTFRIRDEMDRRRYCRRVISMDVLEELRSHVRRRHNNQRQQDIKTAIDEVA